MDDPFTGERVCLVPALVPDVALIHVQRADAAGNAQIAGAPYMDRELAGAAKRVIVTTEELVSSEEIVATADRTAIPHFLVAAVVEVPFGSFPHECYGMYEASFEHFDLYQRMIDDGGDEGARPTCGGSCTTPGRSRASWTRSGRRCSANNGGARWSWFRDARGLVEPGGRDGRRREPPPGRRRSGVRRGRRNPCWPAPSPRTSTRRD